MRRVRLERQVSKLVYDQKLGLCEEREPLLEPTLGMRLGQLCHERRRGNEQHRIAGEDRLTSNRDGEMGFPDAWWAKQQNGFSIADEPARGEFPDLFLVDRRLRREVEAFQVPDEWEPGEPDAHLDPPLILARNLALAEQRHSLPDGELAAGGFVDQAVELVADRGEFETCQHGNERILVHHHLPPISCSYSRSGRNKAGSGARAGATMAFERNPTTPSK